MTGSPSVELATAADELELRRLLRENPMAGEIQVGLECEPDARFAAAVVGEPHATVVARAPSGGLLGMGSRSVGDAYINGRRVRLGYLSQLRLDPAARGKRRLLRLLAAGYDRLREERSADEEPFDVTTILADNLAARRLLEAGLPGLPTYRPLATFVTLVLPVVRRGTLEAMRHRAIEPGSRYRLSDIHLCLARNAKRRQLAPRFSVERLESPSCSRGLALSDFHLCLEDDRVTGCLALWNQQSFKQIVVRGYAPGLARLRPALNLVAPLLGLPRLPAVGSSLPHAYLSHVAVDGDDPQVFMALLASAFRAARGRFATLVCGFIDGHPLLPVLRRVGRAREVRSVVYAVFREEGRQAVEALDGRLPHLEVAFL